MSQQLQITGGAKVRDLQDVIIGTSGVLSSLAFNVANGVPKLDVNGKILVSQLPNSVMEYLGTWDASTNTPTLVNGTGNQGDVYLCNVAGTVNFGAGPITFAVGDSAIYSGTIWQKAGGATGTVTSVGLTSTGNDAITITGSPITTSGNINLGFAGTNLQYINGAGDLTTFPTLISSIGLTMPSAFSVANSPLTSNGTIAVTGAGYPSQYIRGDGTLADFPTSGGGGSSVSYYLNGGTSQGTIGGVTYYEMSKTADTGTMADFSLTGDGFIVAFLTDAGDPAQLNIPAGNWNYEIYASMSANGGTPQMYAELYVYDGTTFTLISTSTNEILYDGTNLNLYSFGMTVPATILTLTDRLAIKLYSTNSGGKTTTVHTQDSHLCQIITTFSTGITALNGLTAQVQYFATGTSGTDFNISSATATHTFNIPSASDTNRGLVTTGTQTFAGQKTFGDSTLLIGGLYLYNSSGGSLAGYMNIMGLSNGVRFTSGTNIINTFTLPSATGYTYTFPSASGTLALTSNLSAYLPLTGGTLSGSLSASTYYSSAGIFLSTSGQATSGSGYATINGGTNYLDFRPANGGIFLFQFPYNTTRTFTLPDATGTLALGTGTTNYHAKFTGTNTIGNSLIWDNGTNVGIGNTNTSYTLDVSGTLRTTGQYKNTFAGQSISIDTGTTASARMQLQNSGANAGITVESSTGGDQFSGTSAYSMAIGTYTAKDFHIGTNSVTRLTVTSGGNVLIGTTSVVSPGGVDGICNIANASTSDGKWALALQNSGTVAGAGRGIGIRNTTDYNSAGSEFIYCVGNTTARFIAVSNGGLYNYSGNNVNLASDRRLKKDIVPLSSEWEKLKQIEVVNYKYKDATDETSLYGAIAQQVQEVYPELVIVTREATETEPEYYGLREQPFQWLTTKVLQEAMAKIEEQQIQIQNLQEQINILAK